MVHQARINQSINRSINQSLYLSIDQSINRLINLSIAQPSNRKRLSSKPDFERKQKQHLQTLLHFDVNKICLIINLAVYTNIREIFQTMSHDLSQQQLHSYTNSSLSRHERALRNHLNEASKLLIRSCVINKSQSDAVKRFLSRQCNIRVSLRFHLLS